MARVLQPNAREPAVDRAAKRRQVGFGLQRRPTRVVLSRCAPYRVARKSFIDLENARHYKVRGR